MSVLTDSSSRAETVLIEDLLCQPGRQKRPRRILIILRGLPGSGKTFVAKLIKVSSGHPSYLLNHLGYDTVFPGIIENGSKL